MTSYVKAKHKQHYVWRYYLAAWSTDEQLYCLRGGKIFSANIKDVAQKRDFYRVQELSEYEIELLFSYVKNHPKPLQEQQKLIIKMFNMPHVSQRAARTMMSDLGEVALENLSEFEKIMDVVVNNLEEELHAEIERNSMVFIDQIRAEDISFWEGITKTNFLQFVCLQMLRTRKMQEKLKASIEEKMPENTSLHNIWGVLRHMVSMNVAYSIYTDSNYGLRLLLNDTQLPYLTTDQPVVNTHSLNVGCDEVPKEFEIYYPISPRKAILIGLFADGVEYPDAEKVRYYNDCLAKLSHEQIFASSRSILDGYV